MAELIQRALNNLNRKGDGDMVDRLSASATVTMLIVAAVIVSAKQYVGQPIQCWVPAEMKEAMEQYVENYCYVQNTYFLPFEKPLREPGASKQRSSEKIISYYQWVPFILILQAVLFYTPRLFWRVTSHIAGVNFDAMHTMARRSLNCESEQPDHCYRALADYVHWALNLNRSSQRRSSTPYCLRRFSNWYLIVVFFVTKLLYVGNAVGQIFLLDAILQTQDPLYGINMVRNLLNGTEWQQSGFFPRSTMCDVEIRAMGKNLHRYTVQCVLMINVFNEKLFIFLWFWTMFVAFASICCLTYWLCSSLAPGIRRRFIRRLLPELPPEKDHPLAGPLENFVERYLGVDGVFFLRTINDRVGSIVTSKVTTYLWRDFLRGMSTRRNKYQNGRSLDLSNFDSSPPTNVENRQCLDSVNGGQRRTIIRDAQNRSNGAPPQQAHYRQRGGNCGYRPTIRASFSQTPDVVLRRRDTDVASSSGRFSNVNQYSHV